MSISAFKTYWVSHKWARVTAYIVGVLVVLSAIIGILLNALLGPSQLTPLVKKLAKDYTTADVYLDEAEATFFSTFPKLRFNAKNLVIVSKAFHTLPTDTMDTRRDTLLRVQKVSLGLNFSELMNGNVKLGYIALENPTIRLVTDALGRTNWDIMREDTVNVESADTTSIDDYISMHHIRVKNGKFAYIDVPNNKSFFTKGISLKLDGDLTMKKLSMDVEFSDSTTTLKYDGTRFFHRLPLGMDGHIDCENFNKYKLSDFHTKLGDISMDVDGDVTLVEDSVTTEMPSLDFNLTYKLSSPELSMVFGLIPQEYLLAPVDIETGLVRFDGSVKGIYTANNYPQIHSTLEIDSVQARYEGMKEKIDDLSLQMKISIDDVCPDSSYMHMNILHFLGGKSELTARAFVDRMFSDPIFKARIDGYIDLKSMLDIFPIKGLEMEGMVDAKLGGKFKLSDIKKHDYGNIVVGGKLKSDKLSIKFAMPGDTVLITDSTIIAGASKLNPIRQVAPPDTFNLQTDLDIKFLGKDTIRTEGVVKRMRMTHPHIRLSVRDLEVKTKTFKSKKDTNEIAVAYSDVKASRFRLRLDSLMLGGRHIHNITNLRPSKANKYIPYVENSLDADTMVLALMGTRSMIRNISLGVSLERLTDTTWNSNMHLNSKEVRTSSPLYKMPITLSNVNVTQKQRTFDFKNVSIQAGRSNLNVSGQMHNLYYSLMAKQPFNATFNIQSDTLDVNELLSAVILDEKKIDSSSIMDESNMDVKVSGEKVVVDSAQVKAMTNQLVYISKRIRFSLKTNVNTLLWNTLTLDKVRANVEIANRTLHMTNFTFNQGKGRVITTFSYRPSRKRKNAQVDWFMRWERADISELVKTSGMDTIMPMMAPLRGLVDCYMAAQTTIDSTLTPDLGTTRMSAHIGAHKVTLLDGETFAHISKLLLFKNKKENVIDTLSFNVLLDSGKIEVLPFAMSMDRYRACIGGSQDLDMNLKYHVSILKSPLPFKAGVDISGTPDKLEYDITKAKLKKYATDQIQAENDAKSLAIRLDILRHSYTLSGLPLPEQLKTPEMKEQERLAAAQAEQKAINNQGIDKLKLNDMVIQSDSVARRDTTIIQSTGKKNMVVGEERIKIGKRTEQRGDSIQ